MSIRNKLIILLLSITVIPILLVTFINLEATKSAIADQIIKEHDLQLLDEAKQLNANIKEFTRQVLITRELPPIQGIIRARRTGTDFLDGSTLNQWKDRLEVAFKRMIEVDDRIDQMAYLDEDGNEVVRMDNEDTEIRTVHDYELHNQKDTNYFLRTMEMPQSSVFISSVDLKKKREKTILPYQPIIRISTPIFKKNENRGGILLMNIRMSHLFAPIRETAIGSKIMIDQDGIFLIHSDRQKEFKLDLKVGDNFFEKHPYLITQVKEFNFYNNYDAEDKEYQIWRKIFYDPSDQKRFWVIFSVIEEDALFATVLQARNWMLGISLALLVVVVFIALLASRSIARPIQELKRGVEMIEKGNLDFQMGLQSNDEIGQFARSFNQMAQSLQKTRSELLERANSLASSSQEVENKSQALEKQNINLTRTKEAMVNIMKELEVGRKQLAMANERLKDINSELEQFAHVASHDLQEPLRKIAGFTQLLDQSLKKKLNEIDKRNMAYILEGVQKMQTMIKDMLQYSRLGRSEMELKEMDFNEVLRGAVSNLLNTIRERAAIITNDPLPTLKVDSTQMLQLFQNLIGNAIKYNKKKSPKNSYFS